MGGVGRGLAAGEGGGLSSYVRKNKTFQLPKGYNFDSKFLKSKQDCLISQPPGPNMELIV